MGHDDSARPRLTSIVASRGDFRSVKSRWLPFSHSGQWSISPDHVRNTMGLPEKVWVESYSKLGSVWSSAAPAACLTRRRGSSNGVDGAGDRRPDEDLL